MRFIAPARGRLPDGCFDQAVFAGLADFRSLLGAADWPDVAALDAALHPLRHRVTGQPLALVDQDALDDGEHYEQRIFRRGLIATRAQNWHDLLNALVWKRFPAIKSALNAGQVQDLAQAGVHQRTRRQYAMTQFDEAGAVLVLRDAGLLAAWDRHDWEALFLHERAAWSDGRIQLAVFGHALFEHALQPAMLLVAKTLVLMARDEPLDDAGIDREIAAAIAAGDCLGDPQQLRPLPMAGIPGWHRLVQDADFYRRQPCFRPLRAGRVYPAPLPGAVRQPA
jgi:hypothetical protein